MKTACRMVNRKQWSICIWSARICAQDSWSGTKHICARCRDTCAICAHQLRWQRPLSFTEGTRGFFQSTDKSTLDQDLGSLWNRTYLTSHNGKAEKSTAYPIVRGTVMNRLTQLAYWKLCTDDFLLSIELFPFAEQGLAIQVFRG